MGCSIQDQILGYTTISKKLKGLNPKVPKIQLQFAINDYWLSLENNMMTDNEKQIYKLLVEQTDGLARINLGGKGQINEAIVILKEVDGDYIIHLESGKNYTFAKGKIKSKTTAKGQTVTMPAMVLTADNQDLTRGGTAYLSKSTADKYDRVSKNRQLAKQMVEQRADNVTDKVAWNKYASKVEKGKYPYNRYSGALRKTIESVVKPSILIDVTGLMLSEVHNDKVILGDYNPDTHTLRIAKDPTSAEIADKAETAIVQMYLNMNKDSVDLQKLTELVGKNKARVVQRIVNTVEEVKGGHTLTHELIHAGSTRFMLDNPKHKATKRIEELYAEALAKKDEIQSMVNHGDVISTYWQNSRDEFVAEALSNPGLMYALGQVKTVGKEKLSKGMFANLVETLIGMLGLNKKVENNLLEYTMDGFAALMEAQAVKTTSKSEIDLLKTQLNTKGSDANVAVGKSENDVASEGFDVNLGMGNALLGIFLDYYKQDLDAGTIAANRAGLYDAYTADPAKIQSGEIKLNLTDFDKLQGEVLKTYSETMANIGTKDIAIDVFENAVENTAGSFNPRTQELKIRWNKMSRLSKKSEVFLHEVNHKMSSHVFADNMKLRRLMEDLRDSAVRAGKDYTLFLEGIENPTAEEIEIAKMKYEYTFDPTADAEEFYAYATTNESVYNAIKDVDITTKLIKYVDMKSGKREPLKTVLNKLIKVINNTWALVTGRGEKGGQIIAEMLVTVAQLDAERAQIEANTANDQEGVTQYAANKMNELDDRVKPIVEKVADWSEKLHSVSPSKLGKHIEKIPVLNELVATGIAQYLWRTVTQDTTKEGVSDMYMVFRHSKQVVEKHTTDIRNGVKTFATEMYKDVDESTKDAVTKVLLEADLAQFNSTELKSYLADEGKIDSKIAEITKEIEDGLLKPLNKETKEQIDGLAKYLVDGTITKLDQVMNAHNIAYGIHSKDSGKSIDMKVGLVDKLVSLKALKLSDSANKIKLKQLLDTDSGVEAIDKTVSMYRGYIDNMRLDATIDGFDPIPKGYVKPANGLLRYELIPADQVKAQESVLMKKVENEPYMKVNGINYYLMTGRTKSVGFTEGAIGLISHTTEGIPVSGMLRQENDMRGKNRLSDHILKAKTKAIIKSIQDGETDKLEMLVGKTLVPVYNHKKDIVDYRVQLNSLEKKVHLPDRETKLEDVLSSTFSRSIKTSLTATANRNVVDTIIQNSSQGVLEDPDAYELIEEYTEEDKMNGVKRERRHDRWDNLPDHTKNYIYEKIKNKGILIHKDFVELMTGEKDITIGNFAAFGFELRTHPVAKARLMALEAYVGEILGYVKNAMIVLNGDILVGNQVSNAMVAANHGINPVKYTKKFAERWKQLNDYNEKVQMLSELEVKQMAGENVDRRIKQLEKQLEGNIWDELVKDGQYTALVEDINIEDKMDGQLATMIQKKINDNNYKGVIEGIRNGLYIDKTSGLYNTMLKTVHYGDAITRQIIKEELEEKAIQREGELTDKTKQDILNYLDQLLVNYGYIQNRWWNYADKKLGLMFMKYYLNQPKALMSMARNNPTKIALLQGAQVVTGVDIADPVNTYSNSGLDGVAYRWMFDDAPGLLAEPNILDLFPSMSAALTMR